jgi:hypothetical protein
MVVTCDACSPFRVDAICRISFVFPSWVFQKEEEENCFSPSKKTALFSSDMVNLTSQDLVISWFHVHW